MDMVTHPWGFIYPLYHGYGYMDRYWWIDDRPPYWWIDDRPPVWHMQSNFWPVAHMKKRKKKLAWLVVYLPLWTIWKSVRINIPIYYGKKIMFQSTNQLVSSTYPHNTWFCRNFTWQPGILSESGILCLIFYLTWKFWHIFWRSIWKLKQMRSIWLSTWQTIWHELVILTYYDIL